MNEGCRSACAPHARPEAGSIRTAIIRRGRAWGRWFSGGVAVAILGFRIGAATTAAETLVASSTSSGAGPDRSKAIILVGAPGEERFGKDFATWAGLWQTAATNAGMQTVVIGLDAASSAVSGTNDLARFEQAMAGEDRATPASLWLILIGHGTYDGKVARFNLRGPDLDPARLVALVKPVRRPVIVIDTSSASAPFLRDLSGTNRIVITATRSGYEQNFARFGQFLAQAIQDPLADLDKDEETSLLEAWLMASRRLADFYKTEGRLATEHPLLDDNGDGAGTPADWFKGVRLIKRPSDARESDGRRAHELHFKPRRDETGWSAADRARWSELEAAVAALRERKARMNEDDYYRELEVLLLEISRLGVQRQGQGP